MQSQREEHTKHWHISACVWRNSDHDCPVEQQESRTKMATEFLLEKWRKEFRKVDVNKDNLLTVEDGDIFANNFSSYFKFDEAMTAKCKAVSRSFWKEFLLQGLDQADEDTYVSNMEKAYVKDREQFRKDARRLFGDVMDVVDVNKDRLLSEDEFVAMVKSTGFKNYDKNYMKCYPQEKPGYISIDLYLDVYVEFNSNGDINNAEKEKPRHYGLGILEL